MWWYNSGSMYILSIIVAVTVVTRVRATRGHSEGNSGSQWGQHIGSQMNLGNTGSQYTHTGHSHQDAMYKEFADNGYLYACLTCIEYNDCWFFGDTLIYWHFARRRAVFGWPSNCVLGGVWSIGSPNAVHTGRDLYIVVARIGEELNTLIAAAVTLHTMM